MFCWKLLQSELSLDKKSLNAFAGRYPSLHLPIMSNPASEPTTLFNTVHFLGTEYQDYMRRCIVRARSIQRRTFPAN